VREKNNPSAINISTGVDFVLLTCAIAHWKKTMSVTSAGLPTTFFDFFWAALITALIIKLVIGIWGNIIVMGYKNRALAYNVYRYLIYVPISVSMFAVGVPEKQHVVSSFAFSAEGMLPVFMLFLMPAGLLSVPVGIVGVVKFLGRTADNVVDAVKQEETDRDRDRRLKELQIKKLEQGVDPAVASPSAEERISCPMCAEKILPAAKICPFCKSELAAKK